MTLVTTTTKTTFVTTFEQSEKQNLLALNKYITNHKTLTRL